MTSVPCPDCGHPMQLCNVYYGRWRTPEHVCHKCGCRVKAPEADPYEYRRPFHVRTW